MRAWALLLLVVFFFLACLSRKFLICFAGCSLPFADQRFLSLFFFRLDARAEDAGKKPASDASAVGQKTPSGDNDDDDGDDDDDEDEDEEEEEEAALPSSPDVHHAFVFAGSAEKRMC